MEIADVTPLRRRIAEGQDLVEFEVVPVVDDKTTCEALEPPL